MEGVRVERNAVEVEAVGAGVGGVVVVDAEVAEGEAVYSFKVTGPLGEECLVIEIGTAGFRYFIRGRISRQNFLTKVSWW